MSYIKRAFFGLLVIAAVACGDPSGPSTRFQISGTVSNLSTGAPVAGALVVLETIEFFLIPSAPLDSALTDANGRFTLSVDAPEHCLDIWRLRATAENYRPGFTNDASGNSVRCTSDRQVLNIVLLPH